MKKNKKNVHKVSLFTNLSYIFKQIATELYKTAKFAGLGLFKVFDFIMTNLITIVTYIFYAIYYISMYVGKFTYTLGKFMYYNGLTTGEKEKIDSVNKNNLNKYKYVDISVGKKVDIKENNYYLVYLKGGNVYKNEDNAYGIFGLEYGIRQVKDKNLNNIEVLNNDSLKYESISRVIT